MDVGSDSLSLNGESLVQDNGSNDINSMDSAENKGLPSRATVLVSYSVMWTWICTKESGFLVRAIGAAA